MPDWTSLFQTASLFAKTELGRILATVALLVACTLLVELLQGRTRRRTNPEQPEGERARRRRNFVLAKNLILLTTVVLIATIWASKIAGAALSLAAVAGATLMVSKEFWLNLLGSLMLAIGKPYGIGDFIEIENFAGRVIDSDLLTTTLAETQEGRQITGRTVTVPHSILLNRPVRNLTATGAYMIGLLRINVAPSENVLKLEQILLSAATQVCAPWHAEAQRHLERRESRELVDLPSADPKVLIELTSAREYSLALRYCCRPNDRVKVEQAITRQFLQLRPQPVPVPAAAT